MISRCFSQNGAESRHPLIISWSGCINRSIPTGRLLLIWTATDIEGWQDSIGYVPVFLELTTRVTGNTHRSRNRTSELTIEMTVSDQVLLGRALDADEDSFTALYRRRQGAVFRFALQMTGDVVVAEDVTQEVFLTLLEHGRRFDPARGTLASFLYGIARNLVRRRIEKERVTEAEAPTEEFAGDEDLLEDLTRRETIGQVRRAVLSLPAAYREAVVLCDLQDLSYQEAAEALECPVGTVRSRLNRARAILAQKLSSAARSTR
jgi:RNA polymerase sigma-70 factor (ECF subfamily)